MAQFPSAVTALDIPQVKPLGPLEAASQALGLQRSRQDVQMGSIELKKAQQAQQDEADLRQAAQETQGDPEKMQQWLNMKNPKLGLTFEKAMVERHKQQAEIDKTKLDQVERQTDMIGRIARGIKDEPTHQAAVLQVESLFGPEAAKQLGPSYDPAVAQRISEAAMKTSEYLQSQQDSVAKRRLALDEQKTQDEREKAWEESAAHLMEGTTSPADFAQTKANLIQRGVPSRVFAAYGDQWTPEVPNKARAILGKEPRTKSFEEETFQDFQKNPALTAQYGTDRIAFDKYKQDQAVQRQIAGRAPKEPTEVPDLKDITETTRSGRKYVPIGNLSTKQKEIITTQASKEGIPFVDKDTASTLAEIDTARANQEFMLNAIESKLPRDAVGRVIVGPANRLKQISQLDPELAATGTFRNAAIQSMRAVAGSKGLRINQFEVQMAIDNDIPKPTDTVATAQKKLGDLKAFLDNAEKAHLVKNRQTESVQPTLSLDDALDKAFGKKK